MDFFRIFELGDVIITAQYVIHELFQRAGPLREVHDEVVLQTLIEQGAFINFSHPIDIVVTAADDADDRFISDFFFILFQGRNG